GLGKTVDFNIVNNTMRQTIAGGPGATQSSNAINVFLAGLSRATTLLRGTISGNTIGNAAVVDSGSQLGIGIDLFASGAGNLTAQINAFLDTTATTVTPPSQSFIFAGTIRGASAPCPTP